MILQSATDGRHTLLIHPKECPSDPREGGSCFGKMICFHKKYSLGDKHDFDDEDDFLRSTLADLQCDKQIYEYIRRGHAEGIKLEYDRSAHEWQLLCYGEISQRWYIEASYPPGLSRKNLPVSFQTDAVDTLSTEALLEILNAQKDIVMLPLFLYDHSGITMRTSGFSCPWDTSIVGWIYADKAMIEAEYGSFTKESVTTATALLQAEVKSYDLYLTGQCYGYSLYDGEEEIESSYDFLGDLDDFTDELKSILPDECRHLVDKLEHCPFRSIGDYFWNQRHKAS